MKAAFPQISFVLAIGMLMASTGHTSAVTIGTVAIGNPGNPSDMRYLDSSHPNGVGSVAYSFRSGKTEVTNAQYVGFLNAIAAADPNELYSPLMESETWGGIVRSGAPGGFTYSVKIAALDGAYSYGDKPVVYVSSGDAMRFANWMHHGQPQGAQDASTTEDGAYTLNGATTEIALAAVTRNAGARWWLPNEDEWYKAAYHKNDGATGNYWDYPTGTNSVTNNNQPFFDTGNSANTYMNGYTTGDHYYSLTNVGAYTLSDSPYGTFDQGGNVAEVNETLLAPSRRGLRGGGWTHSSTLSAATWGITNPTRKAPDVGFRVASAIPEPGSLVIAATGAVACFSRGSKPRRRG